MPPSPDPADLFDSELLPELPFLPADLVQAFRDTYVAGYLRALQEVSGAVAQAAAPPAQEYPAYSMYDYEPKEPQ